MQVCKLVEGLARTIGYALRIIVPCKACLIDNYELSLKIAMGTSHCLDLVSRRQSGAYLLERSVRSEQEEKRRKGKLLCEY